MTSAYLNLPLRTQAEALRDRDRDDYLRSLLSQGSIMICAGCGDSVLLHRSGKCGWCRDK
jgi:hypothetical protein